ncbi:amino acid adenylation domain-containing protein [Streptomyces sp. NBC_00988]|uniref:amino acid adenylation domain-containing protein n=1 Tax=Streptomyces sp. NBC_00988 TaxID=2903704 RepID=UPI00386BEA02|nr:amino acid adenylation domain-containing protein [Streptomyces sp. NBC_00988]
MSSDETLAHQQDAASVRAELLRRRLAGRGGRTARRSLIERADRGAPLPLSFGQQQMWFLNRMDPDSVEYAVPLVLRLRGPLDTEALTAAWERIVERHEILRTRYALGADGEPVQLIDAQGTAGLPPLAVAGETGLRAAVEAEIARPFDLERDQPVRATLMRLAEHEHVLVVVFHHIACDAWSVRLFAGELSTLYGSSVTGTPAEPEPLTVQYADYAAWQRRHLTGNTLERELAYWREQLAGNGPLELPTDRPRPAVRDWDGDSVPFTVPAALADRVRELSLEHGTTPFALLLTVYQLLLSRHTGTSDIPVGVTVSGRNRPELQQVIGYGINTLVVRGRWADDPSFAELLTATAATVLDAFEHQSVPFARLVDDLQPERDPSRTPLFQADFVMHEDRTTAFDLPGLELESVLEDRIAKFDLTLNMTHAPEGRPMEARLGYATSLFDRTTIERMTGHFLRLLESVTTRPKAPLSAMDMLTPTETTQLLTSWNPVAPEEIQTCVHHAFEAQAARTPDAVAIVFENEQLTYRELNEHANRIAHHLRALGARPDSLVGVCLERSTDLIPALLGVLKSGAGYLPLDPGNPADRLGYILDDAGAPLLITHSALEDRLPSDYDGTRVLLDSDSLALASQPTTNPAPVGTPENLIYVIYTSGSTGRPKGVALTHANVLRLMLSAGHDLRFGADDVWTLFHSYAFDVSVWEMWGALLHGGRLILAPFDTLRSPDEFLDLLVAQRVTVLCQTPTAFRSLTALAAAGDPRIDRLGLRAVVFAGERLDTGDLLPWTDRLGLSAPTLVNMYGITETTVHSTYHELTEADLSDVGRSFVGRPLSDLSVHLLDADGNLVPVGVPGEIHIGGAGLARGYLNRPDLTAERFVPDPHGPAGSRLYKSGDLARRHPDGSLEFLGRIDTQIKIRGYRIELGEITHHLRQIDGVTDAAVTARDNTLTAYVVGSTPDPAALRTHLAEALPDYMIPSAFVGIDRIPLTHNGKLDTHALPTPDHDAYATATHVAPRDAVEQVMAATWAEILGRETERISVHDSFFDLGGDSIRAVRLAGALRELGYETSVRDIFEHRTVAQLAAHAGPASGQAAFTPVERFALIGDEDRAALPTDVVDAYPLSQTQTGMLVEMLTGDRVGTYLNINSFRVPDHHTFSTEALEEALRIVAARHDILRTSTHLDSYTQPLQLVHGSVDIPMTVEDVRELSTEELRAGQEEFVAAQRAATFTPAVAPMLRVHVHVESDNAWRLTLVQSHAITEGWSVNTLVKELLETYGALRDGEEAPSYDAPGVRYADFIAAELASLESELDRGFWKDITDRHAPFVLPEAWAGPSGAGVGAGASAGASVRVSAAYADLEPRLRALASHAGASLKSVLLAAHLKVMSALTTEDAFHTGIVTHGRLEAPGAEKVLGMHLNTLPVPFRTSTTPGTWTELVRETFAHETDIWGHRRYPLPAIQHAAGAERLISVLFDYLDFHHLDSDQIDTSGTLGGAVNEFALNTIAQGGFLHLTATTNVLTREYAERLAAMYRTVLEAMATDPHGSALGSPLPLDEQAHLLTIGTAPDQALPALAIDQFEAQAATTPDAIAVAFGGVELTYRQLDERANQIAHHLCAHSTTGAPVGIYLERSTDLVASLLATWKAGSPYLPLDPKLPGERLTHILTDTNTPIVITTTAQAEQLTDLYEGNVLVLDTLGSQPTGAPERQLHPLDPAYIIYTSGSTGTPKGVVAHHQGLANYLAFTKDAYAQQPGGAPLFSPITFDLGIPNIFTPLITGQPIRLLPHNLDTTNLGTALAEHAPYSFIKLTPAHLELLTHQLTPEQARTLAGQIIAAGDTFTTDLADRWYQLAGPDGTTLATEYGPTEITIGNSGQPVPPGSQPLPTIPLGDPIPNTAMHVLDTHGNPTPYGIPGEVHISGTGLTHGYLNQPHLTAERFVPDPHGPAGTRLYKTGDLARRLPDGSLEFLGRIDTQVKINGYRIELGEITHQLRQINGIADAAVIARDNTLTAYLVGSSPDLDELNSRLSAALPDYMIPSAFVGIDRIPLTHNGKLDTRALPNPDRDAMASGERVAPRTPAEREFAAAWADVLQLNADQVSVEDSFFDLGGDSIRAVRLAGTLREHGYEVGIRDIFTHRTIAQLAAHTRPASGRTAFTPVEPFTLIGDKDRAALPADATDAYPLSQIQTGMLVEMLASTGTGRRSYHNINSFRVPDTEPFSLDALRDAIRIVVDRHDILRTSIHLTGFSQPLQIVHASAEIPLAVHDLRALDTEQQAQAGLAFAARQRADVFDPAVAPLVRATVHLESDESWRLTFTQSHAITEGWSYHSMLMEILELYPAIRDGEEPPAHEPLAVRYADYIAAELKSLDDPDDQRYWKNVTDTHVPFTVPETWADPENPAERYRVPVPFAGLEDGLRALASRAGASFKTVLLAAHLKVMSALTTERAFHTGLVTHGRLEAPGAEKVLGMHLNTLPVPHSTGTARTWLELVEQTYARETEAWTHRRYPLPAIQRDSGRGQRLVSVMFDYIDFHHVDADKVDVRATLIDGATEFDLHVSGSTDAVNIIGSTDVVGRAEAQRLAGMFHHVLESMAADPEGSALGGVLSPAETTQLLTSWNPVAPEEIQACVHQAFEEQAARTPDAVAIVFGDEQLTYRELNERANRIAHLLRALGTQPDSLVGVCLERSLDLIPALLGVLKSGGAYLPLDPANPADRLGYILEDAGAPLLITHSALGDRLPSGYDGTRVLLDSDSDAAALAAQPTINPAQIAAPHNLIYVIYTSGSTGRPKGVALTHANVLRLFGSTDRWFGFGADDVWTLFHSYAFDFSVWEIWGPLLHGGRLVVVPYEVSRSPEAFLRLLAKQGVTVLNQTPSAFYQLIEANRQSELPADALALRHVVFGGEALDPLRLGPWYERHALDAPVLSNMYGITETTVHTTYHPLDAQDLALGSRSRIGRPLSDLSVHLLDADGNLVPVGVPGEIHIGGAGLARGYLNRPDLTAERFVPDPHGPAGTRLYKSGDLARRHPDGTLEFLGRIDTQIKIRGYRIELGEITHQLRQIDGVADAAVTAHDNTLTAYLVGSTPDPAALRAHLAEALPDYMIPSAYVGIDHIPLTHNGKLDTQALPNPDHDAMASGERVAPRTPAEREFAAAWADVLQLNADQVSVEDSFFDLGGDSIRAVRLAGTLREHGHQITIRDIFTHRTIAQLAAHTRPASGRTAFTPVERFALIGEEDRAALPTDVVDAYPLSQTQTGMLVEMLTGDRVGTYLNINSFRVLDHHTFSTEALEEALRIVAARHDILRTSMHLDSYTQPLQLVHESVDIPAVVHDIRHLDEGGRREAEFAWAREERASGLEVAVAPMLRVHVHLESDDAWRLTLVQSHAITEGWSVNTLTVELLETYGAIRDGEEPPAYDAPGVRYADFIAAELKSLDDPADQAYWQDVTDNHVPLTLPEAWADPSATGEPEPVHVTAAYADLEPRLRALASHAGASLKSVLLAAHLKVLSALTTEDAFHTGLVTHGRLEAPGAERVLGMHLNTLPLPHTTGAARTWLELVQHTYTAETAVWGHRRYPLPAIQHAAGAERLVSVLFDYLDFHHLDSDQIDTSGTLGGAVNEFALNTIAQGGFLHLTATTDVLTREYAERLAAMYRTVLEAMAADPEGSALGGVLSGDEQARLLAIGTAPEQAVPGLAIDQFEAQAATTPDAIAVTLGQVELTYRQLDERANQIAHHLCAHSTTNAPVGIYLERSTDLVASLLATWKAGSPYLPLDPKLPNERLTHILTDTNAPLILTTTELAPTLPELSHPVQIINMDTLGSQPTGAPERQLHPLDPAYIIYTSGSTGTPKGVVAHHQGLANYLAFTKDAYAQQPGGAPLFSPITFDLGIPNIFTPLITGQPIRLLPHNLDTTNLGTALAEHAPYSFIKLTPAHLELLTHQLTPEQARTLAGQIIAAGDTFTTDLADRWYQLAGPDGTTLATEYGPTEITIGNSGQPVPPGSQPLPTIPLGDPIPNTAMHVLDTHGNPTPYGIPGEVHISGTGLTHGYLNRPDLTAERFVPDPHGPAGTRLYKTGDLARRLPDGSLEFLGRIDTQVKINGYRIELGEITHQLRQINGIADAAVIARDNTLTAYLVGSSPDLDELNSRLSAALPDYMIPSAFVGIDRIPLTHNGKLDTRALPNPDRDAMASGERVAPRTPAEREFAAAWADVLQLNADQVSVEDSFFDLGGDSIRAVRLAGTLREHGYEVGIRDIFTHRTIAQLAAHTRPASGRTAFTPVEPFTLIGDKDRAALPADATDAYPLSQIQTGMLVEMLADEEKRNYLDVSFYRIPDPKPFSADALREAAAVVAARHDILRTSTHLTGFSQPLQIVHATVEIPIRIEDVRDLDEREQYAFGLRVLAEERAAGFDIGIAPLLRIGAYPESDDSWRLNFTHCHAATEGWSMHSLTMELLEAYGAIRDGEEPPTYDIPDVRYADYIAAELKSLDDPDDQRYWQEITSTHAPITLPEAWGNPGQPREPHRAEVPYADLEKRLRALAGLAGASLKSVFLAAHLKVMSALTTEDAFHTGIVTHGRLEAPGAEKVLGMHLNTLPVPFRTSTTPGTWTELVRETFAHETDIWGHRRYPLPAVQRTAGAERLISVVFEYLDFHQMDGDKVDVQAEFHAAPNEFSLNVSAIGGSVYLATGTDVLTREYAERLAAMYRTVLEAMATDPHGSALGSPLPLGEQAHLLTIGTAPDQALPALAIDQFEAQAATTPDAIAVAFGGVELTYRQLDERANQIAHHLCAHSTTGAPVGIYLERSTDLVASLLATWKAGSPYLPLDPKLPNERLTHILTDTNAPLILTTTELAPTLPELSHPVQIINMDTLGSQPTGAPERQLHPLDPAYIIYTSGSTGTPKGVVAHHQGLANYLAFTKDAYAQQPGGAPLFSPITFDLGIPNIFTPLITGQPIRLLPHNLDTTNLGTALAEHAPYSFIKLTPAHLELLTHQLTSEQAHNLAGQIIAAGDTFTTDLADRWYQLAGPDGTTLATEYGPTEITIGNSGQPVPPGSQPLPTIPLGDPIPNTAMHVLDTHGNPTPYGIPGEVHISGTGLTHGYLNQPHLTADKYIPDPHGPAGTRLYKTGDLARRHPDGSLEFLGRIDTQIKIRGYRIELGEITHQLRQINGIADAAVTAHDNTLTAYLVGSTPDPAALRAHLADTLPDYMIPSAYVGIDHIPLTHNGKLDTRALPHPDRDAYSAAERVAPVTDGEKLLTAVWADILDLDSDTISTTDTFFDLGGDSIRAVRLAGALREHGRQITIRDIFEHRTIAQLAAHTGTTPQGIQPFRTTAPFALISEEDRAALATEAVDATDAYPLSQIQTGMLVEMLADPDRNTYHSVNSFRLVDDRELDRDALRRAVDVVSDRHETLRTSIRLAGFSQPLQIVHASAEIPLAVHDLRALDTEEMSAAGLVFAEAERQRLFELAEAPLVRINVHLEPGAWRLTFTHCNAITEGWSYHSLLMEILELYRAIRDGEEPPAYDAPDVRYADYIAAELKSLDDPDDQRYWKNVTDTHVPMAVPESWADRDRPVERYRRRVEFGDLEESLRALGARAGASLKAVLIAAHLKVMSALTTEEAFHAGLVCHGRLEEPGADRVLGMHLNTLPFPHSGTPATWLELVKQTYAQEIEVWSHRRHPLPAIQRAAGTAGRLVSVMLEFHDFHQMDRKLVDATAERNSVATDFAFHVIATRDSFHIISATDTVSHEHAERLCGMYRQVLADMAADPHGSARAGVLPAEEAARVLAAGHGSQVPRPVGTTVHRAFAERVARHPEALAVVAGTERLTYRELDERANRIAHQLRALGARPDTLVGLCLDRGPALLPALLGILKSGAAYVSLDPANPMGRLTQILDDTRAPVVVTSSAYADELATSYDGELVVLDRESDRAAIAAQPAAEPAVPTSPENLAYVLYTSGSTGTPKGVGLTHANVLRLFRTDEAEFVFRDSDVWAMFHSYAFDTSVWEMWGALLHGGRLVVVPPETARSPEDLLDLLVDERISVLCQTPTAFRGLAALAGDDRVGRLALRAVVFAGERLDMSELLPWAERLGLEQPALVNMYGITETSVYSVRHRLGAPDLGRPTLSVIGTPLGDQRVHVLDRYGNPAPVGVPGEIHVGGPAVARGYRGRADLTAERFVPDPFGPAGGRLYRSGDLARLLPDGSLEFLGRIDTQVKIRGYRIELGEIQAGLRRQPGVRDAVVLAREDVPGDKVLVAYVVAEDGAAPDPAGLRAALAAGLPAYMVPTAFVPVDRVPLTPNGKLDHRALPAPDRTSLAGTRRVAPRTDIERRLARVWAEVLRLDVDAVGADDNFFGLGGDSIRAVRLLPAARREGLDLSIWMLYRTKTLAELAAVAGADTPDSAELPLTPAQRRTAEDTPAAQSVRLPLSRRPDPGLLERALRAVVARHQALRLRLPVDGGTTAAVAAVESAEPLRVVELGEVPADGRAAAVAAAVAEDASAVDPVCGPVLRASLCHFGAATMLNTELLPELWITVHELAVDEASWTVLVDDLNLAYRQLSAGEPVELPPVGLELAVLASELAEVAASDAPAAQAQAWLGMQPGRPLPVDRADGENTFGTARTATVTLSAGLTEVLLAAADPEALLLTALGRTLSGWSGGDRVGLDLAADPRTSVDGSRTVGLLTDRHPLTLWLPANRQAPAQLRSVARQLDALPEPRYGYGLLRHGADEELAEDLALLPRPEVGFTFSLDSPAFPVSLDSPVEVAPHTRPAPLALAPQFVEPVRPARARRPRLLDVDARVHDGQLYLRWTYSTAVHDASTVCGLADRQLAELSALLESPETPRGTARTARARSAAPHKLAEEMSRHEIPGAALALIRDGELTEVHTYGTLTAGGGEPVTEDTLFAAGSISKHVTTVGVLKLVERGVLNLDTDVAGYLTSWRLPGDPAPRVTLRHLLSHTAGFAVQPPFKRYRPDEPVPSVTDILHGRPPASPAAFAHAPGEVFAMTALNFSVLQQVMCDVTGEEFPVLMRRLVLAPLGMTGSDYDPAFVRGSGRPFARGHETGAVPVPGGHQVMPELAAGSLWSTAPDLARLTVAVRRSYLGLPNAFLPQPLVRDMLTPQPDRPYGWSVIIDDTRADMEIGHGGQATGFQAMFGLRMHAGTGAVLLTNATTGRELVSRVLAELWPDQTRFSVLWRQATDAARTRERRAGAAGADTSTGEAHGE